MRLNKKFLISFSNLFLLIPLDNLYKEFNIIKST